jgi:hexokinase
VLKVTMARTETSIAEFLSRNRLHPSAIDLRGCCDAFVEEMKRGLEGRPSSLPMIATYIETARDVPRGERVISLDAGGTNMRVAGVSFDKAGVPVIDGLTRHRMPGVDKALSREEFFRSLAEAVRPHLRGSDRIGFCFSYPAEITPQKDGRLTQFTKEIKAKGVEGQLVGAGLLGALPGGVSAAGEDARVVLLNDTVATLLAGRNALPGRRFDDFIGLVCGTGLNAAYVERNSLITKVPGIDPAGSQVVNTESGSFALGGFGPVDDAFDQTMANPGKYRHEKTISGAYLGALCLFAAQSAARAGCFSTPAARLIEGVAGLSTRGLNDFLLYPHSAENPLGAACADQPADDARGLYVLCDSIVERAAALVAVNLSAIVLETGKGRDPRFPVCITADGTTFWQLRTFHARVESWMRTLLSGDRARAWEIASVADAPLLGAAIAALTN